jgi:Flp pilus assembly protein TadG
MMRPYRLRAEERGATLVEFALLVPVLLGIVIGAAQIGILFFANAGLQHAIGEGSRVAMIWPRPSDAVIREAIRNNTYGLDDDFLVGEPVITPGTSNGCDIQDISWSYRVPLNFILYETPPVTLTHSRRVFVQPAAGGVANPTCVSAVAPPSTTSSTGGATTSSTGGTTTGGTSTSTSSTSSTGGTTSTSSASSTGGFGGTTSTGGTGTSTGTGGSTSSTGGGASSSTGGGNNGSSGGGSTSSTSSTSTGGNASSGNGKGSSKAKGK